MSKLTEQQKQALQKNRCIVITEGQNLLSLDRKKRVELSADLVNQEFKKRYSGDFNSNSSEKAFKALKFYDSHADDFMQVICTHDEKDFDWDRCKAICRGNITRFMQFVADYFQTTVEEMKLQWKHLEYIEDINKE